MGNDSDSKSLTRKEEINRFALELTKIGTEDARKKILPPVEDSLKRIDRSLDDYLDLIESGELPDRVAVTAIGKFLVPVMPKIIESLAKKAQEGDPKTVELALDLMGKVSDRLSKYKKAEAKHLHIHYEKMDPVQLGDEGFYQAESILKVLVELPEGMQKVREMYRRVLKFHKDKNWKPRTTYKMAQELQALREEDEDGPE